MNAFLRVLEKRVEKMYNKHKQIRKKAPFKLEGDVNVKKRKYCDKVDVN